MLQFITPNIYYVKIYFIIGRTQVYFVFIYTLCLLKSYIFVDVIF